MTVHYNDVRESGVTVLICTYNRHVLLGGALRSLVQGCTEKPDQIVVVNGGDERADQVVREYSRNTGVEVELLKTVNKNLAASRNVGLPHCRSEIIAMTDDDAEVFPDWITQMKRRHLEHPEAGAVGGSVIGTNTDSLVGKVADLITFPSWPEARAVRTLPGVNISYKRTVVERIGPQDETLFRGEDVDYNWRVQQLGYSIYFDPTIRVYHHHRPTTKALLRQHYMYGQAYYLLRRKWPEMYCIYPHGVRGPRDVLKAINFFAAPFYQPFLNASKLSHPRDRLVALPTLLAAETAWRLGMVVQGLRATLAS
jgi:GT2 family glycosyltransferase